ncbi:gas vesicle protein K [Streptomyces sp. NPDC016459]|uniref:gas vesicle protein K n=1 Tax=Streptomyces sp. NPDC016459 TaxID=3157190 RepID=UPI0033C43E52
MSQAFRLLQAPPTPREATPRPAHRMYTDRDTVEEDLLKLVLTLVELLRQLIERQALRRVDAGDLTDEQEEELGATLLALHDRLADLCAQHGYALEDLNLDLGPLGPLLPPRT